MAFNNQPFQESEARTSKFNAGMFKMQRLHELWDKINKLNQIPLAADEITGEENYKLLYRCYNSLFLEAYPKLSDEQKKTGELVRKVIGELIKKYPARVRLNRNGNSSGEIVFNQKNWERIEEALFVYEKKVREFIDITGMDNPDAEDDTSGI